NVKVDNPETIVIVMSQFLFHPFSSGFFVPAIFAAIMSTISSHFLVTYRALTHDFYMLFRARTIQDKEHAKQLGVVKGDSVFLVTLIAMYIAWHPNDTIVNLVGNAWAGFGAAFGPLVLLSLYWKRLTKYGAIAGIVSGSLIVIFWILMKEHGGIFEFY